MYKQNIYILIISVIFISCKKDIERDTKKIVDLNTFSIEIPSNWNEIKIKGIDSYVGGFVTDKGDTIKFDYGEHTSKIDQVINVSHISEKKKLDSLGFPVNEMFFSKTPNIDKNQGVFHNEYYYYEEFDNKLFKIQLPKQIGKGITKIYGDSVDERGNKLAIVGRDLDTITQFKLLRAFSTVKIKNQ